MPFAVALILLVLGSILFHLLSPWTFTPLASNWGMVDFTVDVTLYVTAIIFIAVNLFVAVAIIKYRHREGVASKARYEPENKRLEVWLTVLTAIGVAAMLTPGLLVWARFVEVPEEAHVVEVVGQQWHWSYRYPGADGKFGQVDAERISKENPLGIDPEDPLGRDDVVVLNPEAHLPIDRPVKLLLRSKDVLHNYTVAQFRVKMDLVPGMDTYMWLEPTEIGRYEVLCEELCGIAHHTMRGAVVVEEAQDFETWLANQQTFGELAARRAGRRERRCRTVRRVCGLPRPAGRGSRRHERAEGRRAGPLVSRARDPRLPGRPARQPRGRRLRQANGAHGENARG